MRMGSRNLLAMVLCNLLTNAWTGAATQGRDILPYAATAVVELKRVNRAMAI